MRCCLNRKVIIGLAVVAVGVLAVDPHLFGRVLPLLLVAICPLSMVLMMRGMSGNKVSSGQTAGISGSHPGFDAEVARLRAEVDQLRAERSSPFPEPAFGIPTPGGASDDAPAAS
ncbi:MAG: DUF2933 domain-containing protein [Actinomycetota bacterium]|jgi:hypothetical protein|nr:DUF2933 domain-containing protein [Actinomycetota bacterium]